MNTIARILTMGALSTMSLGTALAADSTNTARKSGLGYGSTIGGTQGISFRHGFGGGIALEILAGFSDSSTTQTNSKTNGVTSNSTDVGLALDYKIPALRGDKVAMSLTGDFNYAKWSDGTISGGTENETSYDDMAIGLGMRTEYFPAGWMSINTRFGLAISPNGEGQQAGSSGGGDTEYGGMDIATTGDLFGAAGVTFWFR
jgi:hypothetical protein